MLIVSQQNSPSAGSSSLEDSQQDNNNGGNEREIPRKIIDESSLSSVPVIATKRTTADSYLPNSEKSESSGESLRKEESASSTSTSVVGIFGAGGELRSSSSSSSSDPQQPSLQSFIAQQPADDKQPVHQNNTPPPSKTAQGPLHNPFPPYQQNTQNNQIQPEQQSVPNPFYSFSSAESNGGNQTRLSPTISECPPLFLQPASTKSTDPNPIDVSKEILYGTGNSNNNNNKQEGKVSLDDGLQPPNSSSPSSGPARNPETNALIPTVLKASPPGLAGRLLVECSRPSSNNCYSSSSEGGTLTVSASTAVSSSPSGIHHSIVGSCLNSQKSLLSTGRRNQKKKLSSFQERESNNNNHNNSQTTAETISPQATENSSTARKRGPNTFISSHTIFDKEDERGAALLASEDSIDQQEQPVFTALTTHHQETFVEIGRQTETGLPLPHSTPLHDNFSSSSLTNTTTTSSAAVGSFGTTNNHLIEDPSHKRVVIARDLNGLLEKNTGKVRTAVAAASSISVPLRRISTTSSTTTEAQSPSSTFLSDTKIARHNPFVDSVRGPSSYNQISRLPPQQLPAAPPADGKNSAFSQVTLKEEEEETNTTTTWAAASQYLISCPTSASSSDTTSRIPQTAVPYPYYTHPSLPNHSSSTLVNPPPPPPPPVLIAPSSSPPVFISTNHPIGFSDIHNPDLPLEKAVNVLNNSDLVSHPSGRISCRSSGLGQQPDLSNHLPLSADPTTSGHHNNHHLIVGNNSLHQTHHPNSSTSTGTTTMFAAPDPTPTLPDPYADISNSNKLFPTATPTAASLSTQYYNSSMYGGGYGGATAAGLYGTGATGMMPTGPGGPTMAGGSANSTANYYARALKGSNVSSAPTPTPYSPYPFTSPPNPSPSPYYGSSYGDYSAAAYSAAYGGYYPAYPGTTAHYNTCTGTPAVSNPSSSVVGMGGMGSTASSLSGGGGGVCPSSSRTLTNCSPSSASVAAAALAGVTAGGVSIMGGSPPSVVSAAGSVVPSGYVLSSPPILPSSSCTSALSMMAPVTTNPTYQLAQLPPCTSLTSTTPLVDYADALNSPFDKSSEPPPKKSKTKKKKVVNPSPSPESEFERVFIWELDDTCVLLEALLNGSYAAKFNKDGRLALALTSLGQRMDDLVTLLAQSNFFYSDLEECDQVHIEDAAVEEAGQDLANYGLTTGNGIGAGTTQTSTAGADGFSQAGTGGNGGNNNGGGVVVGGGNGGGGIGTGQSGVGMLGGATPGTPLCFPAHGTTPGSTALTSLRAGSSTPTGGGVDWMRKLSYRYKRVKDIYNLYKDNIPGLLGSKAEEWKDILAEIELGTEKWHGLVRSPLNIIANRRGYANVVITNNHLVTAAAKLLLFRLAPAFPIENIYSARKAGRDGIMDRIQSRFGKKATYVMVGSGTNEEWGRDVPHWPVTCHDHLATLNHALDMFL